MKRCLVYNFSGELDEVAHLFPNERLARVAAIVHAEGIPVSIVDRANLRDLIRTGSEYLRNLGDLQFDESNPPYALGVEEEARILAEQGFDTIFMNLWHGSGFKFSMDLAAALKRMRPAVRIYGIGQKVDWFAEAILDLAPGQLDGLITGLGYNAVQCLARGQSPEIIPNMILPAGGSPAVHPKEVINVDDYPAPIYDPGMYGNLDSKVPIYSLTLSNQACANQCAFCVRPENYGRLVRARPIAAVLSEMRALHARGVTHFRIEDSTPPRNALSSLAVAISASELCGEVALSAFSRVDVNSAEDFAVMRRAGILSLFFGLESLDDGMLVRLRKGTTYDAVRRTLAAAHGAGIFTVGCFIHPLPGETDASRDATLARIRELKPHLDSVLAVPAGIYPPTDWGRHPERYGIQLSANYLREAIIYPIKFEVPIERWRPFPFTYPLFGKTAERVTFADIAAALTEFVRTVKSEIGILRVPDYYLLLADWKRRNPSDLAREIVGGIMRRDYEGLRTLLLGP